MVAGGHQKQKIENHTPGPWKTMPSTDKRPYWHSEKATKPDGVSAEPMMMIYTGEDDEPHAIAYVWKFFGGRKAMEANARLIVVAPELLEACEDILIGLDQMGSDWGNEKAGLLRSIIAKVNI